MITLFTFGPAFGLPDASPFVTKVEILLKLAEIPYETDADGFNKAPKGKLPYIRDGAEVIADSSFIRKHLEEKYAADFTRGLNQQEIAVGYAFEKLCEDHLYWAILSERWLDDANFNAGPRRFFDSAPALLRPFVVRFVRKKIARDTTGQGTGKHSEDEVAAMGAKALTALSDFLGEKPYFMGETVTGTDATVFPFVAGALCPHFTAKMLEVGGTHANLAAYCDRMMQQYYPDLETHSG